MRQILGLVAGASLALAACGDTAEEEVAVNPMDSLLATQRDKGRVLEMVGGNTDSVFKAASTMSVDAVVGRIKVGMGIQVLPAIIGTGVMTAEGIDTLKIQDGFRRTLSVVAPDLYTVIWFRKQPGSPKEPILRTVETPIVLKNDAVVGTGWVYYDSVRVAFNLPAVAEK